MCASASSYPSSPPSCSPPAPQPEKAPSTPSRDQPATSKPHHKPSSPCPVCLAPGENHHGDQILTWTCRNQHAWTSTKRAAIQHGEWISRYHEGVTPARHL